MRERTLEKNKFVMLQPKALAYDVEPDGDYMRPGNSPPEQAFQLLKCGYELFLRMADDAFPALDRRTRKRGPKYIREVVHLYGDRGTIMLAHAAPALLAKADGRVSGDEPPELTADHHRRLYETVKSFHPIPKLAKDFMEKCMHEYTVMETHEPRQEVVKGEQSPNEYSQALIRGENPDADPELVATQRDYARDYFIDRAIRRAISASLSPNDYKILKDKIAGFVDVSDSEAAEMRERALHAWSEGSKPYLEYALLDAG